MPSAPVAIDSTARLRDMIGRLVILLAHAEAERDVYKQQVEQLARNTHG